MSGEEPSLEKLLVYEPSVSPEPLYSVLRQCSKGFKLFSTIYAAVKLKLFDHLEPPKSAEELSEVLGIDPYLVWCICEILADAGLVAEENGVYKATEVSKSYLRTNSPLFQGNVLDNLMKSFEVWSKLAEALKNPVIVDVEEFFKDHIHVMASEALCGELQKTVRVVVELPEFWEAKTLLDLGGGHGLYAIAFTKLNPKLRAYVFDLPQVVEHTKRYVEAFSADRVEVLAGDFFTDDVGSGYDIVFFSYNPGGRNPTLVPKIHASLNLGGLFINKHVFYRRGEGSKNPMLDIEWNLLKFAGERQGKKIYSFKGDLLLEEYLKLLSKYFEVVKVVDESAFAGCSLAKLGDTLDAKIIVAKKR